MKNSVIIFFALWLYSLQISSAQNNCGNPSCLTSKLIINTGYNHQTQSAYPLVANQQDPYWLLTNAPTNAGAVNLNAPAYVINYSSVVQSNSQFISAFNNNAANQGNLTGNPYSFERCFCVCGDNTTIKYDFNIHVDNQVAMFLHPPTGPDIPLNTPAATSAQLQTTIPGNFSNPPERLFGSVVVNSGKYCIRAELRNAPSSGGGSTVLGLNITGTISTTGNKLQNESCCNSRGFILGYKYNDKNCNGIKDADDLILPNWQIQLSGNGLTQNSTTDAQGYYTFTVPPGTYTVSEVPQTGWSATSPVGGIKNGVVVTQNSINQVDFLNCNKPATTCCPDLPNLIANPYFDIKTAPLGFTSQYSYDNGAVSVNSLLPGEQTITTTADAVKICPQWIMKNSCAQNFLLTNGANNQGTATKLVWQQTVNNLKKGAEYKFCAKFFSLKNCCFAVSPKVDIKFSIPGNDILNQSIEDINLPLVCDFWRQIEKRFTVPASATNVTIQIFLHEDFSGDGNDIGLDDIALVELPQTPKSRTDFVVKVVNRTATTANIIATSNDTNLKDCGVWWKVCEYDPNSPDKCKSGTAMENPSQWWTYPTPVQFWGFDYLHPSTLSGTNPGLFDTQKAYLFEMGVFCPCTGWNSTRIIYDLKTNNITPISDPVKGN